MISSIIQFYLSNQSTLNYYIKQDFKIQEEKKNKENENKKNLIVEETGCKVCEGFKSWTSKNQKTIKNNTTKKQNEINKVEQQDELPNDCPVDLIRLGRHSWTLLHTIGATYPEEQPSEKERKAVLNLLQSLSILFPCRLCANDLKDYIAQHPPQTQNRTALELWLCNAHNHINLRTGKPSFDCSLVAQRWRDGWDDGHCNPSP